MAFDLTLTVYKTIAAAARTLPHGVMSGLSRIATTAIPWLSPDRKLVVERNLRRSADHELSDRELAAGVRAVLAGAIASAGG